ncbi:uncharacterized protein [Periplaneta americana]|uniref:uncharacterized protein n=1 Tax=Periplaneta americana TaxID=6978 RepID=UPI0037E78F58
MSSITGTTPTTIISSSSESSSNSEEEALAVVEPIVEKEEPSGPVYSEEELESLVDKVKRFTTLFDLREDDWTLEVEDVIKEYFMTKNAEVLSIYFDNLTLMASLGFPAVPIKDMTYFLKEPTDVITPDNFYEVITFGTTNDNVESTMLNILQHVYAPVFFNETTWPDNVKSDFCTNMHTYLANLTDLHYKILGWTVIYIPQEGMNVSVEEASKDKELVKRLEVVVVHWTHQIKVALGDQEQPAPAEGLCPMDEYEFWIYRYKNLARLNFQLQNKMLKNVCEILLMSQSTYIHSFLVLAEEIEEGLREAKSNIEFLQILHDPCSEMDRTVSPYDIPKIIPTLLQYIRVIWMNSPYYNTKGKLSALCRAVSNQVIVQCIRAVNLGDIFQGNTRSGIRTFETIIECCIKYRLLYDRLLKALQPTDYSLHANFATAMLQHGDEDFLDLVVFSDKSTFHLNDCVNTHNVRIWGSANPHEMIAEMHTKSSNVPWELDNGSIFNHVDSFVQRCRDMIEICEAMIIFGRKDETKFIPEPRFGGTRGEEFEMIFKRVERTFESNLQAIWDVQTTILDVNAASWYNHILRFRGQMKDIEVILENLMTSVFDQVANVEEGVYALQAFYHYAKRDALHTVYDRKTVDVYKMFDEEIRNIKEDMVKEKNTYPEGLSPFSGQALIISLKKRRLMKLMNTSRRSFCAHIEERMAAALKSMNDI